MESMAKMAPKNGIFSGHRSRKPWLFAVLSALTVLAVEQAIEVFQKRSIMEHERSHLVDEISRLRARLEGVINGNLLLTRGLNAVIAAQPDIDQAGFARIARGLVDERHALRNIAGAPGMVISLMYPIEGNEAAIGLDYRTHPTQRDTAMRAVGSRNTVIAGPLPLVQGGVGIISREPVFLSPDEQGGSPRLWGLISAVIDADRLYQLAGLPKSGKTPHLEVAIRGGNGGGAHGDVFYGDPAVFSKSPITTMVSLPTGSWQIGGVPIGGWGQHSHDLVLTRVIGLGIALGFAWMVYLLSRDIVQRRHAEERLRTSTERLQTAESIAHMGNWEYRVADGRILWSDEMYRIFGLQPQEERIDYEWLHTRVHPDDRTALDNYFAVMLKSCPGQDIPEFRFRIQRLDDEQRLLSVWVRVDYGKDGKSTRLFGTVQDITETQRMHEDLRARYEELTRWQGVMLGREDRIQELKREVNRLLRDQEQPARYPSQRQES